MADPKVQEEIWGEDQEVWVGSPYAPMGVLKPLGDDTYSFSGHWQFSSGTDHCDWIFLGAVATDESGTAGSPPVVLHVLLPRSDYTIVEDSWDVYGLKGTGSKDIVVTDAFIPDYRTVDAEAITDGRAARERGIPEPLYLMPWSTIFPMAIGSAVLGICEGGLASCLNYLRARGRKIPVETIGVLGECAAEIKASRTQLLANVGATFDLVSSGKEVTIKMRADTRRDQVRGSWRAVAALDAAFLRTGGSGIRMAQPMQRFWRDAHAGLHHAVHVPGLTYRASVETAFGGTPPPEALI